MLWNVYWLHDLFSFIVSNRDSQFISIMWQSLCKWLRITTNLSTVYHSEINNQSEWVNQEIECELRIYCNYMQNDLTKWLSMIEFSENSNIFLIISMISFYFNKKFYSWMSFNSDMTNYVDWLHRVEYLTWKVSSWVEIFLKKCRVELRSWTQEIESSWEAWLDNSTRKLNSTRQDIR